MRSKLAIYGSVLLIATGPPRRCRGGMQLQRGKQQLLERSRLDRFDPERILSGATPSNGSAAETVDEGNPAEESEDENEKIGISFIYAQELGEKLNTEPKPVIAYVSNSPPRAARTSEDRSRFPQRGSSMPMAPQVRG